MTEKGKKVIIAAGVFAGGYAMAKGIAGKKTEDYESLNADNPYIKIYQAGVHRTIYESRIKPVLDKVLSFIGLAVLSPVFGVISLAIVATDPGPVFFTQKRVGANGSFFMLHKFRTMKMSAPHDVPTHKLANPEQYITRVGRMLRRTSLDELPQIWDIFRGKMSVIGPRPALWNQDDLVAERGMANTAAPGLTGLAQISGRDELEIKDKAKLDREYVEALQKSSLSGFLMDCRCFFGTIASVLKHDGVVEGGTGALSVPGDDFQTKITKGEQAALCSGVPEKDPKTDWGFTKKFDIDWNRRVRVLITGAGSYIGESFERYVSEHYAASFEIHALDMKDDAWRNYDFRFFDTVFHVAGIAHADVGKVDDKTKELYYRVNTDLAIETAKKAKESGVRQFIFMSSMIIYGGAEYIDEYTVPVPANFYGDSKWQADKGVRALASEEFRVSVLRPPMVYGRGSKGNYPKLAGLAKALPFFPEADNRRSMLYIENLCEFLACLILTGEGGVYVPQNPSYTNTAEMVKNISAVSGKKMKESAILGPVVILARKIPGEIGDVARKAFGSCWYSQKLSKYDGLDYQKYNLRESIERTEGKMQKKALMLASVASMIDLFNADNINILESLGYKIDVAANFESGSITSRERVDEYRKELKDRGIGTYHIPIPRKMNVPNIIISYRLIRDLAESNHYDIVHCHSPIGGVLCRLACRRARKTGNTKVIYTAHGFHFFKGAGKKAWMLYYPAEKICARYTDVLITINHEDYRIGRTLGARKTIYVPGIGIHADEFRPAEPGTPEYKRMSEIRQARRAEFGYTDSDFVFMSIGQISNRKNHEVVIRAIAGIPDQDMKYLIVGFGEEEDRLKALARKLGVEKRVTFAGYRPDVKDLLHSVDAFVFPSTQEGLPVALMEAMAGGLPVAASKIRGNTDLIEDGKGGYLVDCHDVDGFASAMEKLAHKRQEQMTNINLNVIKNFDSSSVIRKMRALYSEL